MHADEEGAIPKEFVIPIDPDQRGAGMRVTEADWRLLTSHLLDDGVEHAALLICGVNDYGASTGLLVQEVVLLGDDDYLDRGALHLAVAPATIARHAKRARARGAAVVLAHSHPFPGEVRASRRDLRTEADLCRRVLIGRTGQISAALVVGPNGVDGRAWSPMGASPLRDIMIIGDRIERIEPSSHCVPDAGLVAPQPVDDVTARQELLWGTDGQNLLRAAQVVVVGCGGTGSHVVQQLAHLRVGRLTIIDPDVVEASNLSRLIGSTPPDVGREKVAVVTDLVRHVDPSIEVRSIQASVLDVDPSVYVGADVIVCATDSHGSRSLLTEVAVQYLVPVVDLGVEVVPQQGAFRAGGGVRVLRPGLGCLWCAQTLDAARVREEYLTADERRVEIARGYLRDIDEPSPSVVALNGVVSSLAVLEICQLLVGMLGSGRDRLLYRAEQRRLATAAISPNHVCHVCGESGVFARGDAVRLKTRGPIGRGLGA